MSKCSRRRIWPRPPRAGPGPNDLPYHGHICGLVQASGEANKPSTPRDRTMRWASWSCLTGKQCRRGESRPRPRTRFLLLLPAAEKSVGRVLVSAVWVRGFSTSFHICELPSWCEPNAEHSLSSRERVCCQIPQADRLVLESASHQPLGAPSSVMTLSSSVIFTFCLALEKRKRLAACEDIEMQDDEPTEPGLLSLASCQLIHSPVRYRDMGGRGKEAIRGVKVIRPPCRSGRYLRSMGRRWRYRHRRWHQRAKQASEASSRRCRMEVEVAPIS